MLERYIKFLNKNKRLVGFAGWKIYVATTPLKNTSDLARVYPERIDKTLRMQLSQEFFDDFKLTREKKEILFHELVHGRVALATAQLRDQRIIIEEDMVNDLTRGYMDKD